MKGVYDESVAELLESTAEEVAKKNNNKRKAPDDGGYETSRRVRDEERRAEKDGKEPDDRFEPKPYVHKGYGPGPFRGKVPGDTSMKDSDDKASADGSLHSEKRRSFSDESDRRAARAERFGTDSHESRDDYNGRGRNSGGDRYRHSGGREAPRSRSPNHYRPPRRDRDDYHRDRGYGSDRRRDRSRDRGYRSRYNTDTSHYGRSSRDDDRDGPARPRKEPTPERGDDERDRCTVFVQQLAQRLRTKDMDEFFSRVGPVKEAQIVRDRVTHRSKGVGYVEFKNEESVKKAIDLTGQQLMGIPVIVSLTEAEKNRQARVAEGAATQTNGVPFHRLYVGNIHFNVGEDDLSDVFGSFGELEFTQLQKDDNGRSKGYGFVQFVDPKHAKQALSDMNGVDLGGRPIRVGLGNDKFTPETTASLLPRFQAQAKATEAQQTQQFQGSAFSGSGGRGAHAGGANNYDRAGGREDRGAGGSSALDDSDVGGVNFNNYSRDQLMRKLARTEDATPVASNKASRDRADAKTAALHAPAPSRCVVIKNAYTRDEVENPADVKDFEDDFRTECSEKYGPIVHLSLFTDSDDGEVWIKFQDVKGGQKAMQGLNGRLFAGKHLTCSPIVDAIYHTNFPKAKDL